MAAASGSVMSRILLVFPNPAFDAHVKVSDLALSDHTAGTVRIYSIGVLSWKSSPQSAFIRSRATSRRAPKYRLTASDTLRFGGSFPRRLENCASLSALSICVGSRYLVHVIDNHPSSHWLLGHTVTYSLAKHILSGSSSNWKPHLNPPGADLSNLKTLCLD